MQKPVAIRSVWHVIFPHIYALRFAARESTKATEFSGRAPPFSRLSLLFSGLVRAGACPRSGRHIRRSDYGRFGALKTRMATEFQQMLEAKRTWQLALCYVG